MSEEGEKHNFAYQHFRPMNVPILSGDGDEICYRYMRGVTEWRPKERGGVTLCLVYGDREPFAYGLAFCCMKDNFSYRLGRDIAKGRALAWMRGGEIKSFNGFSLSGPVAPNKDIVSKEMFFVPAQRH